MATYYSHFTGSIWCHQQRFVVKRPAASYSLVNRPIFPRGSAYRLEIIIAPIDKRHSILSLLSEHNFYKVRNRKRLHAALLTLLMELLTDLCLSGMGGVNN